MAADVFHDPKTVAYGGAACLGCLSISVSDSSTAQTTRSDGGTLTHFTTEGPVSGQLVFQDAIEAAKCAEKTAVTTDLTFVVANKDGTAKDVTIANFKSGGVQTGYGQGQPGAATVAFVADSINTPQDQA